MFFFGHVGITAGIIQGVNHATHSKIDLRKAMFAAILPDLIDKPLGLLYPNVFGNHTRLWGHSLVASALVLGLLLSGREKLRYPLVYYFCYIGHFLLDRIWISDLYALFWPFLAGRPPIEIAIFEKWHRALLQPWTIFGETTGLSSLIFLFFRYRLYETGRCARFFSTGLLEREFVPAAIKKRTRRRDSRRPPPEINA